MFTNTKVRETDFIPFKKFGAYFKVDEYHLISCPMLKDGEMEEEDFYYLVDFIEKEDKQNYFLEDINAFFKTDFKY